ncbi:signal peptide peptidase SppA [Novosphingobium sp.]|uniref:signal peptide peptidase SppA n=1 Tax=Novosphingobium sp. TaxID=1874826 RepID=UPI003B522780
MKFARAVWKILVAIKDGLVLILLLFFFGLLSLALSMKPQAGRVQDGALALTIDGPVVEERSRIEPTALLLGGAVRHQFVERDLVRAIEGAANDGRIHALTLDLEAFGGGSQVSLARIGAAIDKVRHAGKPVLVRAMLYGDGTYLLAAHASEVWVDPLGGVMLRGPGGTILFYHDLLDRLKIKAHVFKVGTYKSAVEPYVRNNLSPEAKTAETEVYTAIWHDWLDNVKRARPKADLALVTGDPVKWLHASGDDAAKAAQSAGLVDKIGDKPMFEKRVAELVGADKTDGYKMTRLGAYLADIGNPTPGKAIAVVTVAGDIVDGKAGPGAAGGDRIAALIDKASDSGNYSALVVRVNSPGGSVTGAERIRAAIARFKAKGLPIAVSMGSLAASGGYWVSTPGDRIFAQPDTITGSIGIFAIIPSFEDALAKIGVGTDSIRTTPLSGQPDPVGGLTPEMSAVLQSEIDMGYRRFVGLVATSRHQTPEAIDKIAQGRVWDGATALQNGLVDEMGGLDQAVAWAAKRAGANAWHPVFLADAPSGFSGFVQDVLSGDNSDSGDTSDSSAMAGDLAGRVASAQFALAGQFSADLDRLLGGQGAQAYCLECAGLMNPADAPQSNSAGIVGAGRAIGRAPWLLWLLRAGH